MHEGVLWGEPGRPRPRLEDNIKIDLQEVGWGGMHLVDVAQGRDRWRALVNADHLVCECGYELPGPIKCGEFRD
jgi:hypothetical protein